MSGVENAHYEAAEQLLAEKWSIPRREAARMLNGEVAR